MHKHNNTIMEFRDIVFSEAIFMHKLNTGPCAYVNWPVYGCFWKVLTTLVIL